MSTTANTARLLIRAGQADATLAGWSAKPTSIEGDQREALSELCSVADAGIDAGIWECTPGVFTSARDGVNEFCHFLQGHATIECEDGSSFEVRAGDQIVLQDGWKGVWRIHETVRKAYVTVPAR